MRYIFFKKIFNKLAWLFVAMSLVGAAFLYQSNKTSLDRNYISAIDLPPGKFISYESLKRLKDHELITTAVTPDHKDHKYWVRVQTADKLRESWDPSDYLKARDLLAQNIAERPNYAPNYVAAARLAIRVGYEVGPKFQLKSYRPGILTEAQTLLERAFALNPNLASAHLLQAELFLITNNMPMAEPIFQLLVEVPECGKRAKLGLVHLYTVTKRRDEAFDLLNSFDAKSDLTENDLSEIAQQYDWLGEKKLAEKFYKEAIRVSGSKTKAHHYYNYGYFLNRRKRVEEAITVMEKSLKLNEFPALKKQLARAYETKGTGLNIKASKAVGNDKIQVANEAASVFQRALEIDPENKNAMYGLGTALVYSGWDDKDETTKRNALHWYREYLKRSPNDANAKEYIKSLERALAH